MAGSLWCRNPAGAGSIGSEYVPEVDKIQDGVAQFDSADASEIRNDGLLSKLSDDTELILCPKPCVSSQCSIEEHLQQLKRKETRSVEIAQKRLQGIEPDFQFWPDYTPRRLGDFHRPQGRVLSFTDPSQIPTLSAFCSFGAGIPMQGPPLWPVSCTSFFHQGHQSFGHGGDGSSAYMSILTTGCCWPAWF
jgi:hypothetical protein